MLSTRISELSGTAELNLKVAVGDKMNIVALQILSEIDKEYSEVYDYIITLVKKYTEDSVLLSVGYVFAYDMQNGKSAKDITKDIKSLLKSKKSYSVSDSVKNSEYVKWWDALVVKSNRALTEKDVTLLKSLYRNAIHYLYVAVNDKMLNSRSRSKKEMQIASLRSQTDIPMSLLVLVIEYSVQQHLYCSAEQAVEILKTKPSIGAVKAEDVKDIVDSAVNVSESIRKWFQQDTTPDTSSNVVYVNKDISPSSSDFDTTMYLAVGAVLLAAVFLFTKKNKK